MTYDKVKLLKQENKQLGRKAVRLVQLNCRFCILLSLLFITVVLVAHLNRTLYYQPKHLSLHQYVKNFFNDPNQKLLKHSHNSSTEETFELELDEFDLVWSDETVELFQDQLGIITDDEPKSLTCQTGEFIVSALPGPNDENLSENVWQYLSLIALEQRTMQYDESKMLSLKAYATEQMRTVLDQLFEGLPLQTLSNLPPTCYNLKYAQIIGNKLPINLKEIAPTNSPLLLDPKAKRIKEIAEMFSSKKRPKLRFNRDIMKEVQQEFLVTKTLMELESEKVEVNFVGLYVTADDKLPLEFYQRAMAYHRKNERAVFVIICDLETLQFCHESFDGKDAVGDARILRKSIDNFDFALLSSCNSTIVSNADLGVLHALINGGDATVYRPEITADPDYYVPFQFSEQMANFYAIE